MSNQPLNEKQKRFCEEYMIDINGKHAAIRAGYNPKTAEQQASRLLRNVKVKEYLNTLREKAAKKFEITQERVQKELAAIAFSDIRSFFNADGSFKKIPELPDDAAAALSGIEVDELFEGFGEERHQIGYTKKIKRWDKVAAIANINKMMGWNAPEKVEHSGDSFLDYLMQTSSTDSENEPRKKKKPKSKAKKPARTRPGKN